MVHSANCNLASNYDRNMILHHFEANVLLYHILSKPQFLNFRLMPHLVVVGHIYEFDLSTTKQPTVVNPLKPLLPHIMEKLNSDPSVCLFQDTSHTKETHCELSSCHGFTSGERVDLRSW